VSLSPPNGEVDIMQDLPVTDIYGQVLDLQHRIITHSMSIAPINVFDVSTPSEKNDIL
jgi:hypothetical protein